MRFLIFTHSLVSDWNHGNAHFLRGIALELLARGHQVVIFEPEHGWSRQNLLNEYGQSAIARFQHRFPTLRSHLYNEQNLNLDDTLRDADVVIVHEWNTPELVARIGIHRAKHDYRLFFHDTHHRILTDHQTLARYDLKHYDAVLAYGSVIRDAYLQRGWARDAYTWHEAADGRTFHPFPEAEKRGDLVWIGNWGDGERADTLREFLIEPVQRLKLKACVYGVRYPPEALLELKAAGIEYAGWLPNYEVPQVFASYRVTVHVPRRPYVAALPGIPTIRPFEALACGIPLLSAPWNDAEHLFHPGRDFLFANDGEEMSQALELLLNDQQVSNNLAAHGLETIRNRHTCAHRVDQLLGLTESVAPLAASSGAI